MPRATEIFGPTFRGEGVIRLDDVRKDPRFGKNAPYHGMPAGHLPVVSYLAVPVRSRRAKCSAVCFSDMKRRASSRRATKKLFAGSQPRPPRRRHGAHLPSRTTSARRRRKGEPGEGPIPRGAQPRAAHAAHAGARHSLDACEETRLPEALRRRLEMIRRNVELEARLIDDLLDLTRVTRGKLELHCERVAVSAPDRQRDQTPASRIASENLKLVRDRRTKKSEFSPIAPASPRSFGTCSRMRSSSLPTGGPITVRTRLNCEAEDGNVIVEVEDTGIGIDPGPDRPRVRCF